MVRWCDQQAGVAGGWLLLDSSDARRKKSGENLKKSVPLSLLSLSVERACPAPSYTDYLKYNVGTYIRHPYGKVSRFLIRANVETQVYIPSPSWHGRNPWGREDEGGDAAAGAHIPREDAGRTRSNRAPRPR